MSEAVSQHVAADKQLEILHDHYKETFARLREVEVSRDRLFLWDIGLFALLSIAIGYPAALGGTLGTLSVAGGELKLQALPLPALLSATWVLTLAVSLRYCQTAVLVNRQYPYLHALEDSISPLLGGGDQYRREGDVYLRSYPLLLDAAWFAYGILFPFIVIGATIGLISWECMRLPYPWPHKVFDASMATALVSFFFLYRVQPTLAARWNRWRSRSLKQPSISISEATAEKQTVQKTDTLQ